MEFLWLYILIGALGFLGMVADLWPGGGGRAGYLRGVQQGFAKSRVVQALLNSGV